MTYPEIDDNGSHHDAYTLQKIPDHVDECCAHTGVVMTTKECMGVAMGYGTHTVLIYLVVAFSMAMESSGMVQDISHTRMTMKIQMS